jgi:predicted lipoprotein with Yx(FWY)xxD motif
MFSKSKMMIAASAAAACCLIAACGGGSAAGPGTSTPSTSDPAASGPAVGLATANADATLRVTTNPKLGQIVVNGAGRTLYRFDKDSASPPASNCNGACAKLWPPVLAGSKVTVSGVPSQLLGTVRRADGTIQLTLHGWPLYLYAGDTAPGDTKGEGIGGIWFAARPTGAKALPGTASSGGYGY